MSTRHFDHGELNIAGRTSGINAELDRYKETLRAEKLAMAKAAAAQLRARRVQAKAIVSDWSDDQCRVQVARLTRNLGLTGKQARTKLNSEAHWAPCNVLKLAQGGAA